MDLVAVQARQHLSFFDVATHRLATADNDAFSKRAHPRGGVLVNRDPPRYLQILFEFSDFHLTERDPGDSHRLLVETYQVRVGSSIRFGLLRFSRRLGASTQGHQQNRRHRRQGYSPDSRFQGLHRHQPLPKHCHSTVVSKPATAVWVPTEDSGRSDVPEAVSRSTQLN